jgi:hypothetical protein
MMLSYSEDFENLYYSSLEKVLKDLNINEKYILDRGFDIINLKNLSLIKYNILEKADTFSKKVSLEIYIGEQIKQFVANNKNVKNVPLNKYLQSFDSGEIIKPIKFINANNGETITKQQFDLLNKIEMKVMNLRGDEKIELTEKQYSEFQHLVTKDSSNEYDKDLLKKFGNIKMNLKLLFPSLYEHSDDISVKKKGDYKNLLVKKSKNKK